MRGKNRRRKEADAELERYKEKGGDELSSPVLSLVASMPKIRLRRRIGSDQKSSSSVTSQVFGSLKRLISSSSCSFSWVSILAMELVRSP